MPGLTTQVDIVHHGTLVWRARGRDRLPYATWHFVNDYVFTNVDNGKYVTIDEDYREEDIRVWDNGDGTNSGLRAEGRLEMHDHHGRMLENESICPSHGGPSTTAAHPRIRATTRGSNGWWSARSDTSPTTARPRSPPSPTRDRHHGPAPTPAGAPAPSVLSTERTPTSGNSQGGAPCTGSLSRSPHWR